MEVTGPHDESLSPRGRAWRGAARRALGAPVGGGLAGELPLRPRPRPPGPKRARPRRHFFPCGGGGEGARRASRTAHGGRGSPRVAPCPGRPPTAIRRLLRLQPGVPGRPGRLRRSLPSPPPSSLPPSRPPFSPRSSLLARRARPPRTALLRPRKGPPRLPCPFAGDPECPWVGGGGVVGAPALARPPALGLPSPKWRHDSPRSAALGESRALEEGAPRGRPGGSRAERAGTDAERALSAPARASTVPWAGGSWGAA